MDNNYKVKATTVKGTGICNRIRGTITFIAMPL